MHLTRRLVACLWLMAGFASAAAAAMTLPPESEPWIRVDTAHITLFSNASEEATRRIGRNLEQFRAVLERIGPNLKADSPLPTSVFVFRHDLSFRPYKLRQRGRQAGRPANISGYFVQHRDGNYVGVDATPPQDPWSVIYHEYFHFFLYNNFTDIPLWFNEGLAECYATFRVQGSTAEIGGPIRGYVFHLEQYPLLPPGKLFGVDFDSPDYHEENRQGTFYAQAWALVEYLMWGPASQSGSGVRFLRDLPRGARLAEAIAPVVGKDEEALQAKLAAYIKKGSFAYSRIEIANLALDDRATVVTMPRDEVLFRLGDLLLHADSGRLDDAEQHFREAIRLNAAHAPAHAGLGQILAERRQYSDSHAAFETAMKLDPFNPFLGLEYAYALIEEAFPPGVSRFALQETPAGLTRARALFERTTRERPEIAEAWAGLGATYALERGDVGSGIASLVKARALLPTRVDVALNLAGLYARTGRRTEAADLVENVISRSADAGLRAAGKEVLFRGDLAAANDLLERKDMEAGAQALRALLVTAPTPALRAEVEQRLGEVESVGGRNREVDQFNAAVRKVNAKEFPAAAQLLEGYLATATDPALKDKARALLEEVRGMQSLSEMAALYNRAVDRYNARDFKSAAGLLHKVIDGCRDEALLKAAKELLAKTRAAAPGVQ